LAGPEAAEISISDFLATAKKDYLLGYQREKADYLNQASSNSPFFDRIELRTETDEFTLSQQSYSVRAYPNGLGTTKNGQKVFQTTLESTKSEHDLLLHQALKKRYLLVSDLLDSRKLLALKKNLLDLYADRVTVLKRKIHGLDFDVNDLIRAEDDCTGAQLELIDFENRIQTIEDEIRVYLPAAVSIEFDTGSLAGVDVIEKTMPQCKAVPGKDNVHLRNRNARLELARSRYELEKSENRKYISFLEAAYDSDDRRHNSGEVFSVQLGFRLPFINSGRLDINRRKLAFLTEKRCYAEFKNMLSENIRVFAGRLHSLLRQYEVVLANKKLGGIESSLKSYMRLEGADPLALLELKESILKRDISLANIQHEIFLNHIELLDVSGKLSEPPLKNYFSASLEPITP